MIFQINKYKLVIFINILKIKRERWKNRNGIKRFVHEQKRKRLKRHLRRMNAFLNSNDHFSGNSSLVQKQREFKKQSSNVIKVVAPSIFSIEKNRSETLNFFSSIFAFIKKGRTGDNLFIDSSDVKKVSISSLMYLMAVLSDAKSAKFILRGNHPKDKDAKKIYKNYGFNKVVKTKESLARFSLNNGDQIWIRGNDVSPDIVAEVCLRVEEECNIDISGLYGALVELMNNSKQHAYFEEDVLEKKWQIFLSCESKKIVLIFLDTGRGIPETVKRDYKEKIIQNMLLMNIDEAKLLKSALDGCFRSNTGEKNRGQGLPQINNFLKSEVVLEPVLYSGKAICVFGEGCELIPISGESEVWQMDDNFEGTLYEWTMLRR